MFDDLQVHANLTNIHFLPFNPVEKRTTLTYIDGFDGKWYCASKGVPE
jgi:H+-transporting ATPase